MMTCQRDRSLLGAPDALADNQMPTLGAASPSCEAVASGASAPGLLTCQDGR
jgi:hypothetical protein